MRYWLIICLLFSSAMRAAEPLPDIIYSYHNDPPFHLPNQSSDLSRAFIESFNGYLRANNVERQFTLVNIDRPSLNNIVKSGKPYLILWANQLWFKKHDAQVKTSWPIFWDADVWVSQKQKPIAYEAPDDLLGKTIGVRKGFYYKGITPLIAEGKIKVMEGESYQAGLDRLMGDQVGAFVMSRSSLLYWFSTDFDATSVFIAQSPHDAFTRNLLYSRHYLPLVLTLEKFLVALGENDQWQRKLKFWGVDSLPTPIELELEELIQYPVEKVK